MKKIYFIFLILLLGCSKEGVISEPSNIIEEAHLWYSINNNDAIQIENLDLSGTVEWDLASSDDESVFVPISLNDETNNTVSPSLILTKESNAFKLDIRVHIALKNQYSSKNNNYINEYFINYDSENKVNEFLVPQNSVTFEKVKENTTELEKSECQTMGVFMTIDYTDGSSDKILLRTYEVCADEAEIDAGESGPGGGDSVSPEEQDLAYVASCRSFEYANFNGIKACGVTRIKETFTVAGFDLQLGGFYYHTFTIVIPETLYFISPSHWTNGFAANKTAEALRFAEAATALWFIENYRAQGPQIQRQWENNIDLFMRSFGGRISTTPPFSIRSPAPYTEDTILTITDCTK